jgi:serine/threonine protein kinase
MQEPLWEQLKESSPELDLELGELVLASPARAIFRAERRNSTQSAEAIDVCFFREVNTDPQERVNRFLEAVYFDHPGILRYVGAGTLQRGTQTFTYAITERTHEFPIRPPALEAEPSFARQTLSALEYLHGRNLVYCALSPQTVVRIGTDWKLSDFSQLRVPGTDTSDEVLSLAATLETTPPEAAAGLISPAWDIWSFGQTLRHMFPRYRPSMPDNLRAVFLACLNLNPSSRPSVQQIYGLLAQVQASALPGSVSSAARAWSF